MDYFNKASVFINEVGEKLPSGSRGVILLLYIRDTEKKKAELIAPFH